MVREINLEPTTEGYANILSMFIESILADVRVRRLKDSTQLMSSVVEISAYLSKKDPEALNNLIDNLRKRARA